MRRVAMITAVGAVLALAGCGDSRTPGGGAPSSEEMASCLEEGGAVDVQIEKESDYEAVVALGVGGDVIFILNLPRPGLAERATEVFKRMLERRGKGVVGVMTTRAFNGGYTLTGVIGREGLNAGMPSVGSEALAKLCATRPPRNR
jgi:hypothetical protein